MNKSKKVTTIQIPEKIQKIFVITAGIYFIGTIAFPLYQTLRYSSSIFDYGSYLFYQLTPILLVLIPYLFTNTNKKQLNRLFLAIFFGVLGWMAQGILYAVLLPIFVAGFFNTSEPSDWRFATIITVAGSVLLLVAYTALIMANKQKINKI